MSALELKRNVFVGSLLHLRQLIMRTKLLLATLTKSAEMVEIEEI